MPCKKENKKPTVNRKLETQGGCWFLVSCFLILPATTFHVFDFLWLGITPAIKDKELNRPPLDLVTALDLMSSGVFKAVTTGILGSTLFPQSFIRA